ncbi:MAG: TonB family protein [Parvibaculum sp.]|uniref:energy transducer TonB n=1 Tax=Parvibaculum sp. TaxID=2024848 RepID=UPI002ABC621B|nr:TonB family protein [Parvibaculum sp.]MDZ4382712.1 TonB family protein [Parvibaculum sp.]
MSIAAPRGTNIVSGEAGHTGVRPFWRGGIAFAIAVHAAVAAGVVFWQFGHEPPQESAAAFTIDLAPLVSAAPVPETHLPEGPKEEETLEEIVEPAPLPEPPLPRDAIAEPEKKPEKKPEPAKKKVKEATAPRAQDVSVAPQTAAPANAAPSDARARALPSYMQVLFAHLERYRRYPSWAQRRGQEGVVRVHFEIDRQGKLLSHSLVESSGSSQLDAGGLETVVRADPFPPLPDAISGPTLEVTVPIRFNLDR